MRTLEDMGNLSTALNARRSRAAEHGQTQQTAAGMDRGIGRPLLQGSHLMALLGGLLLIALFAYGYDRFAGQSTFSIESERLRISTVTPGVFREYIPVNGSVVPLNSVFLDAIDGGQVMQVHVEEGQVVKAGEPLVSLKNTALQLEVIGREAQLSEQINNLSVTQLAFQQNRLSSRRALIEIDYQIDRLNRQLNRVGPLVESGGSSREEFEELQARRAYQMELREAVAESQRLDELSRSKQIDTLKVAVDSLNRNIAIARDNLENLTLRAPITGRLTSLEAHVGESKARGERLGKIDEVDSFKVSAFIDEFYISRILEGQQATADIAGEEYILTVDKVYPEVRNRQFEVDLLFDTMPGSIRRGQTLRLRLQIGHSSEALTLANGAFYDDSGGQWVYLLEEDGNSARRREVQLGRRNPDHVEVISGLAEGDQVITSGYRAFGQADQLLLNSK